MILAIDVQYNEKKNTAQAVGILFNWKDNKPIQTINKKIVAIEPYIPGEFYKRELPCIKEVMKDLNLNEIKTLIVDGHVYTNNDQKYGLGGYVWQTYQEKIPVIGVAKKSFHGNEKTVTPLYRGTSKAPLFVSSIGMEREKAVKHIAEMHGKYRIPTLLKEVDRLTRQEL